MVDETIELAVIGEGANDAVTVVHVSETMVVVYIKQSKYIEVSKEVLISEH